MKVSSPASSAKQKAQHRRSVSFGMLTILFVATTIVTLVFLGQLGGVERNGNGSFSQVGHGATEDMEKALRSNPKCKGKERVLAMLQRATKQSVDEKKCRVPSLLKVSRSTRRLIKEKLPVYNKTTCALTDMCEQLPQWKQVRHTYGEEPVVIGMETCQTYRESLKGGNSTVRIAGLYNSGTHMLASALQDNLPYLNPSSSSSSNQMNWDVVWGKHVPLKYRNENVWPPQQDTVVAPDQILPVVVVRDPFRWMQSMCKTNYDAEWQLAPNKHCPNLVPIPRDFATPLRHSIHSKSYKVRVQLHQTGYRQSDQYDSLAHMWSEWHQQYLDTDIPRLIVRFEDFLFHRERLLQLIAECAMGSQWDSSVPIKYRLAPVKHHGDSSDLVSAVIKYGTSRGRYVGMATEDLRFAKTALDPKLLQKLHYLAVPTV